MRIHVLSDLHLEFGAFTSEPVEADVIVQPRVSTKQRGYVDSLSANFDPKLVLVV